MRRKALLTLVFLASVCGIIYGYVAVFSPSGGTLPSQTPRKPLAIDFSKREPVALNRGPEVSDGFRGELHPLLHGLGEMQVTANWNFDRTQASDSAFPFFAPPAVRNLFLRLDTSVVSRSYSARDFSRFLPEKEVGAVGQIWAIDSDKVAEFLKQFHPCPSMHLVAKGRRAGPDGAFAVLRAVSSSHLDILFRAHAEFDVMPDDMKLELPVPEAWFSPAYFLGRLVIDRQAGSVEYFRLGVPTDSEYNAHVTFATGHPGQEVHGWMRLKCMELVGGNPRCIEGASWTDQIEPADALGRLAKVFYTFKQIDWVAFDKVQDIARAQQKPILVMSALGAMDEQTC
jgi:hypothetical protein